MPRTGKVLIDLSCEVGSFQAFFGWYGLSFWGINHFRGNERLRGIWTPLGAALVVNPPDRQPTLSARARLAEPRPESPIKNLDNGFR